MSQINKLALVHTVDVDDALAIAQSSKAQGLTTAQYTKRSQIYGPNKITESPPPSLVASLGKQLLNPLAIILLVAFVFTMIVGEYIDAGVILTATIINIVISLYQERKAGNAFRALQHARSHEAYVIRNGEKHVIPGEQVVPGDILMLHAGDYVPADGRVITSKRLRLNQMMFTGESSAVSKNSSITENTHVFDRANMVFMGSTVESGNGLMMVSCIGDETEFGSIARSLGEITKDLSPVQQTIKTIARWLGVATLAALVVLFAIEFYRGYDLYETLLLAIAVGVSAVPEGLLSVVTVVLAFGARNIMKKGGLVKNLSSAETLGHASYILTDKTGTLTFGKMKVEEWWTIDDTQELLERNAVLACDVFYDKDKEQYIGDEMDTAIVRSIHAGPVSHDHLIDTYKEQDSIPFDSEYKFCAFLRKHEEGSTVYIKGAPELVLKHAQYVETKTGKRPLRPEEKEEILNTIISQGQDGRRLLAVAHKEQATRGCFAEQWQDETGAHLPDGLVWSGLISFYDKVRSDVPEVVRHMREDVGTRVVMITGDNPQTAKQIAYESGIISDYSEQVYTGDDITSMSDEVLIQLLTKKNACVFARVTPSDKLRLAELLQGEGEVVAMTGDGVNDAQALQKATIGISLSSSTEVAKEAADLVLVRDSFTTIAYAISEGKRMMSNLKKTIIYLIATSFSEVTVLLGALAVAGPLPFYPTQILWANIIEEGLMNFAFIFEPRERKGNHNNHKHEAMVGRHTRNMVIGIGALNGALLLGLYFFLLNLGMEGDELRTYMFAALSIDSIFFGVALKSLYDPVWRVKLLSNFYLLIATLVSFALLILALSLDWLRTILHLVEINSLGLLYIFLFGLVNLLAIEMVKNIAKRYS